MVEELLEVDFDEFDRTIKELQRSGYRLLMVKPADEPREALLSEPPALAGGLMSLPTFPNSSRTVRVVISNDKVQPPTIAGGSDWTVGRAGMMYRDLIPDRLGGKLIASHICIVDGGEVDDSVHYHKIDFQIIYCLKGAIRVVYEDQGLPFWLRPGDCVLQPPEIRHRVLEAEAGSEVIEITSPAEHETWFDHDLELPSKTMNSKRVFGSQRFVRHQDADSNWMEREIDGILSAPTGILSAGEKSPDVYTLKSYGKLFDSVEVSHAADLSLTVLIDGRGIVVKCLRSPTAN